MSTIEHEGATQESIETFTKANKITIESVFIPWSKSRNFDPKIQDPLKRNLNWRVTLKHDDRAILTVDYSAGIAHAPCYKSTRRLPGGGVSLYDESLFIGETEKGFAHNPITRNEERKRPILPKTADVLYSLICDAEVIDYSSFEEWASNVGYDADSRKAETIYRTCLSHALALRNGLSDKLFGELREAVSGY